MKIKNFMTALLASALVVGAMTVSAMAADNLGSADFDANSGVVYDGTNYYPTMVAALAGVHGTDDAVLYCKPDADLGTMTHGHVCKNLTIYGNGAYISGGEKDFELDFPTASGNSCSGLTDDVTLTVDNLKGAGAWGNKTSAYEINLVFTDCDSMKKVFFSGTAGALNIDMKDCTFDENSESCAIYSNTSGAITLDNVDFTGIAQAVALNNKSTGTQKIVLEDCDFENCGASTYDWTVPVSVKSSVAGGTSELTVFDCTFTGTVTNSIGQDADILLDYGVGKTTAVIENTAAKFGVETESNNAGYTTVDSDDVVIFENSSEEAIVPVAKIGEVFYKTLQNAVDAAVAGDTVVLIDNITAEVLPTADTTSNDANALVHLDKDDEITLDLNGKTISVKGSDEAKYDTLAIRNHGVLTITDTSSKKNGKITLAFNGTNELGSSQIHSTILNFGTLTIENGTIENTATTGYSPYGIYNYSWGGNAILTINGGTISSDRTYAVIQAIYDDFSKNNNFVTVNGGTLNGGLYSWYQGACLAASLEINDGKFVAGASTEALRVRTSGSFAMPVSISNDAEFEGEVRIQAAASVGGKIYADVKAAFEAAKDGDTITLLNDVTFKDVLLYAERNGKTWNGSYAFDIRVTKNITLDLAGYTIKSTGGHDTSHYAIICVDGNGNLTITDSSAEKTGAIVNATTSRPAGKMSVVLYSEAGDITLEGGTYSNQARVDGNYPYVIDSITAGDASLVINDGVKLVSDGYMTLRAMSQGGGGTQNVTINGGEFDGGIWVVLKNGGNDVMNFTVSGGTFNATNALIIENYAAPADGSTADSVSITDGIFNGKVGIGGNNVGGLLADGFISGGIYVNDVSEYTTTGLSAVEQYEGKYVIIDESLKVEAIEVKLVEVTENVPEGEKLYDINLVATDDDIINRLNSVDLTFEISNTIGKTAFEIVASNDEVAINPVNNSTVRYEFHFEDKDTGVADTANTITIGQVKFNGYGTFAFMVDADVETNVAHATKLYDNIVDTFIPDGDTTKISNGELVIDNAVINTEILVPTRTLTINLTFPNAVENKSAAYQQMKVTVSGGDLDEAIVVELGSDAVMPVIATDVKPSAKVEVTADSVYQVVLTNALTADVAYNVEISGAGYRTTRYTVTMQGEDKDGKVLNFWNNAKDNETAIEEGKKTAKVTYLAGDIVKDSLINIYDLSAVVSYFGETGLVGTNNDYAKYDLNRDGKIDSKDVAYVLVSWGN